MKQLLPIALDMRKRTLEEFSGRQQLPIIFAETDIRIAIVLADTDGEYHHAGEIVDRVNGYPKLITVLRSLAIIPTMAPGHRKVVHDGHRCRVCATKWNLTRPEQHQDWCLLKGTNPL